MGVAKLSKLFIISHKSDTKFVLKKLQKAPIPIEIIPYTETEKIDLKVDDFETDSAEKNVKVKKALEILESVKDKKPGKAASRAGKMLIKRSEYEKILRSENFEDIVDTVLKIENEIKNIKDKIADLEARAARLKMWSPYKGRLEDIKETATYTIKLGTIKYEGQDFEEVLKNLDENKISCEKLSENGNFAYVILAYHNQFKKEAEEYLDSLSFEESGLTGYEGTINENLNRIKEEIEFYREKKKALESELKKISSVYEKSLTVYSDYLENNQEIEKALESGYSTDAVSFHIGWVKNQDKKKVISIIEEFKSARVIEVQPAEDEDIPIILENKPLFEPFELVVELYGVPRYFEVDPTPFIPLFFSLFFGLCLTDAGYGIVLAVISLVLACRIKNAKKLFMIIFWGSIFSIFAGAIFNGWFGDLPSYLGMGDLSKKFAIMGDPLGSNEGTMNFFRLALVMGVIHVFYGLFIKLFTSIKNKDWESVFLDDLSWIMILAPLIIILLSSQMAVDMNLVTSPIFPPGISRFLIWPPVIGALMIILFRAREEKNWGFRLFLGFLNLTIVSGITSFLGDFLSYIRLMALGLVTAGIGVVINKIAFQFLSIPVVGIVLLIIMLLFGHLFNMVIGILSSFVHTLRLHYVEFFPKFYVGGGRPFRSLKDEHKYVTIIE